MNAVALLAELEAAGVHVSVAGDDLCARGEPGVHLAPYLDRIRAHKPALLAELLKVRIVAVVTIDPRDFDRRKYDKLWSQMSALEDAS